MKDQELKLEEVEVSNTLCGAGEGRVQGEESGGDDESRMCVLPV